MIQQPALAIEPAAVSSERSVAADDAVTRQDDSDGIGAIGSADGADGCGRANFPCQIRIRRGRTGGNRSQRLPHALLEISAVQLDLDFVETCEISGKVALENSDNTAWISSRLDYMIGIPAAQRRPNPIAVRTKVDEAHLRSARGDSKLADRRVHGREVYPVHDL